MSEVEKGRAQAEALEQSAKNTTSSTKRAQLWAGLNRYLATEAEHAHRVAKKEQETRDRK